MHRIEVIIKKEFNDARGDSIKKDVKEDLGIDVGRVRVVDVYSTNAEFSGEELERIAQGPLTDKIVQKCLIDKEFPADLILEIGYKPGVTDNVGATAKEAVEDLLGKKLSEEEKFFTSKKLLISGRLNCNEICKIGDYLSNSIIERWLVNQPLDLPIARLTGGDVDEINLDVPDEELAKISNSRTLALNLQEMKAIKAYFSKPKVVEERKKFGLSANPTDVELESIAQTWSEHCKHKIFNAKINYEGKTIDSLLKTRIFAATNEIRQKLGKNDFCVSVFTDNAGVIGFDKDNNLVFKVETHNSPSAADPYGGSITGIVGVNRDPGGTGRGAKLIANTNVLCFGPPETPEENVPKGVLRPKRIFKGVEKGIEHGGNKSGIPTVNGTVVFDDCYIARPLVYCGTLGIMPKEINGEPSEEKRIDPGDYIVMVGGRIGKDGIHGATQSSISHMDTISAQHVQIGAPIVQKKMLDMLLVARDLGLYTAITDNGAGGLSSSVGEIAQLSNGFEMDILKAPLKYDGLDPWEILVSEAQERMTIAVPKDKIDIFMKLSERHGVESTVLGSFNDSGKFHVKYGERTVAYVNMDFLHDEVPQMELEAEWKRPVFDEPELPAADDYTGTLMKILADLNICSKEWVVRQYDHEVQGNTIIKPLVGSGNCGPSDAAVIKPVPLSKKGLAVSNGINPRYMKIDTYRGTACAIDEAIRQIISVGGSLDKIALLDNFCWPSPIHDEKKNPDGKFKLAQLVRAAEACHNYSLSFMTPFISGKDSMSSDKTVEGKKYSIIPTILISAIGIMDDYRKAITMDVKRPDDLVYVVGKTKKELGGSVYFKINNAVGNSVPRVDVVKAKGIYESLPKAVEKELIASCHDCSDGGLAVALAESAFAGSLGMDIDLSKVPTNAARDDYILFSESQSRFVVTIDPKNKKEFEKLMQGTDFACIGEVTYSDNFVVKGLNGRNVIETDIRKLKEAWQSTLKW